VCIFQYSCTIISVQCLCPKTSCSQFHSTIWFKIYSTSWRHGTHIQSVASTLKLQSLVSNQQPKHLVTSFKSLHARQPRLIYGRHPGNEKLKLNKRVKLTRCGSNQAKHAKQRGCLPAIHARYSISSLPSSMCLDMLQLGSGCLVSAITILDNHG
jgi:hypothetical protein